MDHHKWCHESSQITINHHKFTMTWITTNHKSLQITTNHDMNYHDDPKRALHKAIWLPCYEWHYLDLIVAFLAKLFPQLCSCNWNGNCDLVNDKKVIIWHFCDLFSNYERQKGHNFPILWPFEELRMTKRSQFPNFMTFSGIMNDIVNDKKGHNFVNDKTYWFTWIPWYNIFSFSVRNII